MYRVLVGKPEGKKQWRDLGVDGDNIRMDLQEVYGLDWAGPG